MRRECKAGNKRVYKGTSVSFEANFIPKKIDFDISRNVKVVKATNLTFNSSMNAQLKTYMIVTVPILIDAWPMKTYRISLFDVCNFWQYLVPTRISSEFRLLHTTFIFPSF